MTTRPASLAEWLAAETWPFHSRPRLTPEDARREIRAGDFTGSNPTLLGRAHRDRTCGHRSVPLPRGREPGRGRSAGRASSGAGSRRTDGGVGRDHLFTTTDKHRLAGETRVDNVAMRRVFERCGWVREAHYRQSWPTEDGSWTDSVGYAILRDDWQRRPAGRLRRGGGAPRVVPDVRGRDLPWRRTRDPYAILVSEVMLQQTQVERVVPRYRAWLERWPTRRLAGDDSAADVIREWQGLGYNRRALNLHRAATHIATSRLAGDLTELPGVGRYTAAAIRCFAFGEDILPVDVNVGASTRRPGTRSSSAGPRRSWTWARRSASLASRDATCARSRIAVRRAGSARSPAGSRARSRARSDSGARRSCDSSQARRSRSARSTTRPSVARARRSGGRRGRLGRAARLATAWCTQTFGSTCVPMPSLDDERGEPAGEDVLAVRGERASRSTPPSRRRRAIAIDSRRRREDLARRRARGSGSRDRSACRRRAATPCTPRSGRADSAPSTSAARAR